MAKAYLDMQPITGMTLADLEMNTSSLKGFQGGQIFRAKDRFGHRDLIIFRNRVGSAQIQGKLVTKVGTHGVTAVSNILTGGTTYFTTTGLTAGKHVGMIASVLDVAASAGAAPEQETSIVVQNSTTRVDVDPRMPFSAALAVNDDIDLIATYQAAAAAADDYNQDVLGVVLAENGVDDGNFGVLQFGGINPRCKVLASIGANIAIGDDLIAAASTLTVADSGAVARELCGRARQAIKDDGVSEIIMASLFVGPGAVGLGTLDLIA